MAGWLDEKETRGLLWLKNKMHSTIMVIPCPMDNRPLSIEITEGKADYQSRISKQKMQVTVMVNAGGNLSEQACATDFSEPGNLRRLQTALASAINADIQAAVRAAQQKTGLDFLGFNHVFHHQHDKEWEKLADQWRQLFKKIQVSIRIETAVPRESLFAKPLESKKTGLK